MALYIFFRTEAKTKDLIPKVFNAANLFSFWCGSYHTRGSYIIRAIQQTIADEKKLGNVYYYRQCATPTLQLD